MPNVQQLEQGHEPEEGQQVEQEQDQEALEREARSMGWRPQEEYKGDPEKWITAEEFLDRGQQILPILKANNKRLQGDLLRRDREIGTLRNELKGAQVAIERMEQHWAEANKRATTQLKAQLKDRVKQAREDGDTDAEFEAREELDELVRQEKEAPKPKERPKSKETDGSTYTPSPEFQAWIKENPWFGSPEKENMKRTARLNAIAEELRIDDSPLEGREFMDECLRILEEREGEKPTRRQTSKVEGTPPRGTSPRGSKSFASLPSSAKQACWDDIENLVGPGKRFKTQADWEKRYAEIYYSAEEQS